MKNMTHEIIEEMSATTTQLAEHIRLLDDTKVILEADRLFIRRALIRVRGSWNAAVAHEELDQSWGQRLREQVCAQAGPHLEAIIMEEANNIDMLRQPGRLRAALANLAVLPRVQEHTKE